MWVGFGPKPPIRSATAVDKQQSNPVRFLHRLDRISDFLDHGLIGTVFGFQKMKEKKFKKSPLMNIIKQQQFT
jgi:hypothetical protein